MIIGRVAPSASADRLDTRSPVQQFSSWHSIGFCQLILSWHRRRRQRRTLRELIDQSHILKDIGLSREQALQEAAKPFWRR
jgi:uncharacterized protein YjiS (DUF1127 family)